MTVAIYYLVIGAVILIYSLVITKTKTKKKLISIMLAQLIGTCALFIVFKELNNFSNVHDNATLSALFLLLLIKYPFITSFFIIKQMDISKPSWIIIAVFLAISVFFVGSLVAHYFRNHNEPMGDDTPCGESSISLSVCE